MSGLCSASALVYIYKLCLCTVFILYTIHNKYTVAPSILRHHPGAPTAEIWALLQIGPSLLSCLPVNCTLNTFIVCSACSFYSQYRPLNTYRIYLSGRQASKAKYDSFQVPYCL